MNTNQPAVYGTLTRTLHWLTVIGFVGILTTIALWTAYEDAEWAGNLFGLHKSFGFLTLLLIVFRIIWAAANRTGRPQSGSKAAAVGHRILYLLMLAVPVIGMIRQYGSGRGPLKVFGIELMQGSPEKIEWMANLGNLLHGNLGWLLFAAVVGHIAMVVIHRIQGRDVLYRMTGRVR